MKKEKGKEGNQMQIVILSEEDYELFTFLFFMLFCYYMQVFFILTAYHFCNKKTNLIECKSFYHLPQ